ncbi:unnamed protein product [Vitrella brassicaformis CCMP3155]|uniref:Uncharacterized protein n=2 Tax=Vitrella brassicaformis TaxID=1169539 RepID=A0A0G4FRW3_VITBC|nr:unnamed protein product [Vitrella brassicaformis CCMP3155]|eukprot:CEM17413.1 unnamed protein product [Vitrella brassicaformis CCMP3155]
MEDLQGIIARCCRLGCGDLVVVRSTPQDATAVERLVEKTINKHIATFDKATQPFQPNVLHVDGVCDAADVLRDICEAMWGRSKGGGGIKNEVQFMFDHATLGGELHMGALLHLILEKFRKKKGIWYVVVTNVDQLPLGMLADLTQDPRSKIAVIGLDTNGSHSPSYSSSASDDPNATPKYEMLHLDETKQLTNQKTPGPPGARPENNTVTPAGLGAKVIDLEMSFLGNDISEGAAKKAKQRNLTGSIREPRKRVSKKVGPYKEEDGLFVMRMAKIRKYATACGRAYELRERQGDNLAIDIDKDEAEDKALFALVDSRKKYTRSPKRSRKPVDDSPVGFIYHGPKTKKGAGCAAAMNPISLDRAGTWSTEEGTNRMSDGSGSLPYFPPYYEEKGKPLEPETKNKQHNKEKISLAAELRKVHKRGKGTKGTLLVPTPEAQHIKSKPTMEDVNVYAPLDLPSVANKYRHRLSSPPFPEQEPDPFQNAPSHRHANNRTHQMITRGRRANVSKRYRSPSPSSVRQPPKKAVRRDAPARKRRSGPHIVEMPMFGGLPEPDGGALAPLWQGEKKWKEWHARRLAREAMKPKVVVLPQDVALIESLRQDEPLLRDRTADVERIRIRCRAQGIDDEEEEDIAKYEAGLPSMKDWLGENCRHSWMRHLVGEYTP